MDIEMARQVIKVAFRTCSELQELLPLLKERCGADEYKDYALGIAAAIDAIGVSLTNKALAAHPELVEEIEAKVTRYGSFK
jgi:hypothetical protein